MSEKKPDLEKIKEAKVATKRTRVMMVNPYEFMHLFTKGATFKKHTKLIEGVPEDAKIIGITYDTRRDHILLVLESASYAPVKITDIPPIEVVSIQIGLPGATKKKLASRKKRK